MRPADSPRQMQTIFDVRQHHLSPDERARLEDRLDALRRIVETFPVADLHISIEGNPRRDDVSAKLTLILPGNTLVIADRDVVLSAAFDRCLDALIDLVQGYKAKLDGQDERNKREKGTAHDLRPSRDIDVRAIDQAVAAGDYAAFRAAMLPFEDAVEAKAGRWVQRYPAFEARIGKDVKLADVTEGVFLTAFDRYERRPEGLHLGEWLERLIDPAIKALMTRTGEEQDNINLTRSALSAT